VFGSSRQKRTHLTLPRTGIADFRTHLDQQAVALRSSAEEVHLVALGGAKVPGFISAPFQFE
jgi:hypothetical protein